MRLRPLHFQVCSEEIRIEKQVKNALKGTGAQLLLCHGFSLFHLDDLSFNPLRWFPKTYSSFRKEVEAKSKVWAFSIRPRPDKWVNDCPVIARGVFYTKLRGRGELHWLYLTRANATIRSGKSATSGKGLRWTASP